MCTFFSSESVTEGHPDKVCDRIADAVLDALLASDPDSRCACEVTAQPGRINIMGEITSKAHVDYEAVVRDVLNEVGYEDYSRCAEICVDVHTQSPDINGAVTKSDEQLGAGDQGIMFGYACNETSQFMPLSYVLATQLACNLAQLRKSGSFPWLRSDGKTQVTLSYRDGIPSGVECVVVSTQHTEDVSQKFLRDELIEKLIKPVLSRTGLDYSHCNYLVNPSGRFVLGGPDADTGLTGRKIVVDTYGGAGHHGGGAFSGKDPSKVDRSAAYMARHIAKTVVASKVAAKCEIQLAYAIGVVEPVSVFVDTFGTGRISDGKIREWVEKNFDLRPASIISYLKLKKPIYRNLAAYGHFGRTDIDLTWEKIDQSKVNSLSAEAVPVRRIGKTENYD